jgi:hypothetical protein
MSSLWTPEGEHRVAGDATRSASPTSDNGIVGGDNDPSLADDELEERYRSEMAGLEQELLDAPVEAVIANHCYGLFQLAALHLGQEPPHLESAKIAIDALGAVVEGLGDRLGDAAPTLKEGLAQIRLAFVQINAVHGPPPTSSTSAASSTSPEPSSSSDRTSPAEPASPADPSGSSA